ncbi:hypothetical protein GLOIN_2v1766400 [Rhizophagus irregularis DAOM 181602=DAOM 197198]|nr:hypothetical protein GLOIN_2v1766400 [Rhizophagus irregularis DAOM 181602=DAOM 197198]
MSNSLFPSFHSHFTTQLNQLPRSIKNDIWRRLTTRKYPLKVEEASSIHPVVEELLNREVANYLKKKDRQRLKTTANSTPGGNDTLNRLVLFEQSLSEREKEMTDRENLLHQREEEYTKKLEHAKLEIQKTITNKIKMENNVYLSAESQQKILSLYDLFTSFVPSQALDSTIEPKTYSNAYERDSWYDLRRGVENDPEIRKKYTFRKNSVTQELYIPSRNSPRSNREWDKTIEKIHIFAKSKGYRDSSGATK